MADIAFAIEQVNFDRDELQYTENSVPNDNFHEVINPITDFSNVSKKVLHKALELDNLTE